MHWHQSPENTQLGLMRGKTGYSLLFSNMYLLTNDTKYIRLVEDHINQVISRPEGLLASPTLSDGFGGFVWSLTFLERTKLIQSVDAILDHNIYDFLYDYAEQQFKLNNWDYLHGDLGIVIFSSMYNHYYKDEKNETILERHIDIFSETLNDYSIENNEIQSFSSGYLSFGIAYEFLKQYADLEVSDGLEETLDAIALSSLKDQLGFNNLDYLYGATGIIHYMLRYCRNKEQLNQAVSLFVEHLKKNLINLQGGFAWEDYYFRQREKTVGINLGLAHGFNFT